MDTTVLQGERPLISVIVPVRNCAPYLRLCLASILGNSLRQFELICVDDGSTDDSPAILREFAAADPRVRVFSQEYRGVSSARNRGIDAARADYIAFVDADDWIHRQYLETLLRLIQGKEAPELVVCRIRHFRALPPERPIQGARVHVLSPREALNVRDVFTYVHSRLYRAELFRKFRFSEALPHSEDLFLNHQMLPCCKTILYTEAEMYYRLLRRDSLSRLRDPALEIPVMEAFLGLAGADPTSDHLVLRRTCRLFLSGRYKNRITRSAPGYSAMEEMIRELKTLLEALPRGERRRYRFFLDHPGLFALAYRLRRTARRLRRFPVRL